MHAGWAKRALAVHSVSACLEAERQRIKQARKDISVSRPAVALSLHSNKSFDQLTFQGELLVRADEHDKKLTDLGAKWERSQEVERPAPHSRCAPLP